MPASLFPINGSPIEKLFTISIGNRNEKVKIHPNCIENLFSRFQENEQRFYGHSPQQSERCFMNLLNLDVIIISR